MVAFCAVPLGHCCAKYALSRDEITLGVQGGSLPTAAGGGPVLVWTMRPGGGRGKQAQHTQQGWLAEALSAWKGGACPSPVWWEGLATAPGPQVSVSVP